MISKADGLEKSKVVILIMINVKTKIKIASFMIMTKTGRLKNDFRRVRKVIFSLVRFRI